jgi:hypothetical protein
MRRAFGDPEVLMDGTTVPGSSDLRDAAAAAALDNAYSGSSAKIAYEG